MVSLFVGLLFAKTSKFLKGGVCSLLRRGCIVRAIKVASGSGCGMGLT